MVLAVKATRLVMPLGGVETPVKSVDLCAMIPMAHDVPPWSINETVGVETVSVLALAAGWKLPISKRNPDDGRYCKIVRPVALVNVPQVSDALSAVNVAKA